MSPIPSTSTALELQQKLQEKLRKDAAKLGILDLMMESGQLSSQTESWLSRFVTEDLGMRNMKNKVRTLSNLPDPVVIYGESGTGKEIIAHALHGDRKGNFVPLNVSELSPDLLSSELFGHEKGSFTGAGNERRGLIEHAEDGTLFLDEVADMPPSVQVKLLRFLQEKKVRKVGGNEEKSSSCRVICATNKPLDSLRRDLFFRLETFKLNLTPLRTRKADILLIAKHLLPSFTTEDIPFLEDLTLHGNVRELQLILRRFEVLGNLED